MAAASPAESLAASDIIVSKPDSGTESLPTCEASITSRPRAGQSVLHAGKSYTTVKEGLAHILVPHQARTFTDPKAARTANVKDGQQEDFQAQSVFYNPIQQFNRDLSVLAIKAFGENLCALRRAKHDGSKSKRGKEGKRKREGNGNQDRVPGVQESNGRKKKRGGDGDVIRDDAHQHPSQHESIPAPTEGSAANIAQALTNGTASKQVNTVEDAQARPWKPKFRILDALSATGLRALRYAQEIPFATSITANDLSDKATESITLNIQHNGLGDRITPTASNALAHMYLTAFSPSHEKYDVIDLDPYGTAVPFLDAALQSVTDGGLLCVTCTDAGVWASSGYLEKTYSLYGGLPLKGLHSHEAGLRLILHSIASTAAKYGLTIEPLLSLSIDFYARVFVCVRRKPADVKFLAGKTITVYNCDTGCGAWTVQPLARNARQKTKGGPNGDGWWKHSFAQAPSANTHCEHCGFKTHLAGPMYGGPLHNPAFIERLLDALPSLDKTTYATLDRVEGMLTTALEETLFDDPLPAADPKDTIPMMPPHTLDNHPFFFHPSALAKVIHCQSPPEAAVKGALRTAGYRATRSHTKPGTVKTDAPWTVVWEVMREWVRQKAPIKESAIREGTAGWGIMSQRREITNEQKPDNGEKAESSNPTDPTGPDPDTKDEAAKGTALSGIARMAGKPATDSPPSLTVVFDEQLGRDKARKRLLRYQANPRPNWGPMNRAKGGGG
ncbi:N2,N2-dimethylguanosine tRNA methyltransferase-like protein [Cryomyces antarcticus]